MMDWLPTFAAMAGAELPGAIDGKDIRPLLFDEPNAKLPYEAFFYYHVSHLQAVRSGKWKLYLPLGRKQINLRNTVIRSSAELYDLRADVGETKNVAADHPGIVKQLMGVGNDARADLGDTGSPGKNQRPHATVDNPTPRAKHLD